MTTRDPLDDQLQALKPLASPSDVEPNAERAFRNHAEDSKKAAASAWRTWGRWLEPALVGLFVLIFLVWAFRKAFGG